MKDITIKNELGQETIYAFDTKEEAIKYIEELNKKENPEE